MRNQNPFTVRQIRLLEAIRKKLREINDPDLEIITNESYNWYTETIAGIGKIPKIRFKPGSQSIKSNIMEQAGLTESISEDRKLKRSQARTRHKLDSKPKKDKERLADLFDKEWNNIALKLKKAAFTAAFINQLFSTSQQTISDPIELLQCIIQEEYKDQIKAGEPIHDPEPAQEEPESNYADELMQVE
jgi:hypothetical protein